MVGEARPSTGTVCRLSNSLPLNTTKPAQDTPATLESESRRDCGATTVNISTIVRRTLYANPPSSTANDGDAAATARLYSTASQPATPNDTQGPQQRQPE